MNALVGLSETVMSLVPEVSTLKNPATVGSQRPFVMTYADPRQNILGGPTLAEADAERPLSKNRDAEIGDLAPSFALKTPIETQTELETETEPAPTKKREASGVDGLAHMAFAPGQIILDAFAKGGKEQTGMPPTGVKTSHDELKPVDLQTRTISPRTSSSDLQIQDDGRATDAIKGEAAVHVADGDTEVASSVDTFARREPRQESFHFERFFQVKHLESTAPAKPDVRVEQLILAAPEVEHLGRQHHALNVAIETREWGVVQARIEAKEGSVGLILRIEPGSPVTPTQFQLHELQKALQAHGLNLSYVDVGSGDARQRGSYDAPQAAETASSFFYSTERRTVPPPQHPSISRGTSSIDLIV